MLDLRRLRTLREVALQGSFSGAAEQLHYTQAAVSQQIQRLEQESQMLLVDRTVRPLRLTDAGAALVARAEAALGELAAAEADLEGLRTLESGRLRVGFFSSAGLPLLAPTATNFLEHHPGVDVTVTEGSSDELVRLVKAGDLDLAVVVVYPSLGQRLDATLDSVSLHEDPFALVLPRGHALGRKRRPSLADVHDEPFIVPAAGGSSSLTYTRLLDAACARAGFSPTVAYHITDCQTAQAFVAAGHGVAVFPALALHPLNPAVVARPLDDAPPPREILAVHRRGLLSHAGRAFVEILREQAI